MSEKQTIASLVAGMSSKLGAGYSGIGTIEGITKDRVPTGIYAIDLQLGGGFARGKLHMLYGHFSSGKSYIAMKIVATHQRLHPEETCVWIDVENSYDPDWMAMIGVDIKKLAVMRPDYAEQAADMLDAVLQADDVGVIVIDSLGALSPTKELEKSAEDAIVGTSGMLVTRMCRKALATTSKMSKKKVYPTVIFINQIRMKIGAMGDPETWPGGKNLDHSVTTILRVAGKEVMKPEVNKIMAAGREIRTSIKKKKADIFSNTAEFEMVLIPHEGLKIGEVNDWNLVLKHAKDVEAIRKNEKATAWIYAGQEYKTLDLIKTRFNNEPAFRDAMKALIIKHVMTGEMVNA